jgi:YaiO family outer membrane protein
MYFSIRLILIFLLTLSFTCVKINAQQIDTDSLLLVVIEKAKDRSQSEEAIALARIGIKEAPDYLDFHLLLGRLYKENTQYDSARYFLNHVIERNPSYKDAFTILLSLELGQSEMEEGLRISDLAIENYPNEAKFYSLKHAFIQLGQDERKEFDYLKAVIDQFPDQPGFRQRLNLLELRLDNNRFGTNYSLTGFDRDGVGPWHLIGMQYIRERRWGSLIGRVNYANRLSAGSSIDSGLQYELESYFFTGKRSYSYVGLAYSPSLVFPEQRYGYSFYQNLDKGWEYEIGGRFTSVNPPEGRREFRSLIFGLSKYVGSWWINMRSFVQNEDAQIFPAFTLTSRYYFNTRFDYFSILGGYGTSPDERQTLGQFENRIALDSWRVGAGYFKLLGEKVVSGLQFMYNYQEFDPGRTQQEFEISLMLHYKF